MNGPGQDPIDRITWVYASTLSANGWNPNAVHYQELALLELSILKTGWIQPILASHENLVIDGFHRWLLAQRSEGLNRRYQGKVPVAFLEIPRAEAMMLTVRINRAKGTHGALKMSELVHQLVKEHKLDRQQVATNLGATLDEVDLLLQDGIFQARKLDKMPYSRAWVPDVKGKA